MPQPQLLEFFYILMAVLPIMVAAAIVVETTWVTVETVQKRAAIRRNRRAMIDSLPEVVRRLNFNSEEKSNHFIKSWEKYIGIQLERTGWKISPVALASISITLGLFGGIIGVYLLKGVVITIVLAIMAVFIPLLFVNWAVEKYEQKILNQLPTAIQLFAVEFEMTKNIREALARTTKGIGSPLNKYIELCVKDLNAGKPSKIAFSRLADNLNCDYGRIWAKMLLAAVEDVTVVKLMPHLILRLSSQRLLAQKNATELSGAKRLGTMLNLLIIPGFIFIQVIFPDSVVFFSTPLGKLAVLLVLFSVMVGVTLDRVLKKVDL